MLNVFAMMIALACLAVSHYVLGLRSPLADNVSANVVGLFLGMLFRFWSYRTFVFKPAVVRTGAAQPDRPEDMTTVRDLTTVATGPRT